MPRSTNENPRLVRETDLLAYKSELILLTSFLLIAIVRSRPELLLSNHRETNRGDRPLTTN